MLKFTPGPVPDSLWNSVLQAMTRLTCRHQVPETLLSTLLDHGVVPDSAPSLEAMKQLLVDAYRVFDRRVARAGEVIPETCFCPAGGLRRETMIGSDART